MQFFPEIYAKCNINVFCSSIFRKLHLKYQKNHDMKVQNCYFPKAFFQFDIHIL